MATPKEIMVAVDDSQNSRYAMEFTLRKVCGPNDKLIVLHVRQPCHLMYPGAGGGGDFMISPELMMEVQRNAKEESEQVVCKFLAMANEAKIASEGFHVEGDARDHILVEAEDRGVDLLVLGSRGMGPLTRAVLGSVSGYCLNHAHCPVLVVRMPKEGKDQTPKPAEERTILFAVDESQGAKDAFRWAIQNVCRPGQDAVVIMTAQPMPLVAAYAEYTSPELEAEVDHEMLAKNRQLLIGLAEEARQAGFHCVEDIVKGDAREALTWAVDRHEADLLVMGSRGLGTLSRLFLGSVSSHCCHTAICPVLVFKPNMRQKTAATQLGA